MLDLMGKREAEGRKGDCLMKTSTVHAGHMERMGCPIVLLVDSRLERSSTGRKDHFCVK